MASNDDAFFYAVSGAIEPFMLPPKGQRAAVIAVRVVEDLRAFFDTAEGRKFMLRIIRGADETKGQG